MDDNTYVTAVQSQNFTLQELKPKRRPTPLPFGFADLTSCSYRI